MMKRSAFTLLELVMAIAVIGIMIAVGLPRLDRDLKQEAADNILSAIRYTQHLALLDDKHKFNDPKWQQRFWRIYFGTCTGEDRFFAIGSDDNSESANNGRVDQAEAALDPANGKPMWWHDAQDCSDTSDTVSPNIFITKRYGITNVIFTGGCTNTYIGFDHLGRPYASDFTTSSTPDNKGYMTTPCMMEFTMHNDESFRIRIEPETGYAHIIGQPDS
jgi:prepilin-type N-terminal cleavage/methylation domain-containing protein